MNDLDLLTLEEAGQLLRVGYRVVYEMAKKKQLPAVKVGRQYRIPREALQEWISKQAAVKTGVEG